MNCTRATWGYGMALALAATACSGGGASGEPADDRTNDPLEKETKDWLWSSHQIHVCFSPDTAARGDFDQMSSDIRTWIEEAYGRITDLRFVGWDVCSSDPKGVIQFNINDGGGAQTKMPSTRDATKNVFIGTTYWAGVHIAVVHEFAHALGFTHEFERPNADGTCKPSGNKPGDTYGTPYDPNSITNSTYCGAWQDLSGWDVFGLRQAYGRKPKGSIVGFRNKCLDLNNPGSNDPDPIQTQVWDCVGNRNQQWTFQHDNFHLATTYPRGTLDVQWGDSTDGTPTWNWESNSSVGQTWDFAGIEIRGTGDRCLDVTDGNFSEGQALQIWGCAFNDNQRWNLQAWEDGTIALQSTTVPELCAAASGGTMVLQRCGTDGTRFSYGGAEIRAADGQCMTVYSGIPDDGTSVGTYDCLAQNDALRQAQQWTVYGPIRGLEGKCLEVDTSGGVQPSSTTHIATCNGSPEQMWEYYF